jgi:hypothetical protein
MKKARAKMMGSESASENALPSTLRKLGVGNGFT